MTDRELMQQALEALELLAKYENPSTKIQVRKPKDGGPIVTMYPHKVATDAAAPLRERLAQPEQEPVAFSYTNATEWARIDKDMNVVHLDMDLCAKGPHNAYTALAMAIWNKAIETEREKVAQWMMTKGYATGHGDSIEDLMKELEWQIRESEREACAKVCDVLSVHPKYASDITKLAATAIRARGNT